MVQISVIIPVYNAESYLCECVESVINEGLENIELILVDDGSKDKSPFICDELSEKYKCVQTIHQKNCGVSAARNHGLSLAKGKYVMFLDSDDFIKGGLITALHNNVMDSDFIVAGYSLYDDISHSFTNIYTCFNDSGNIKKLATDIEMFIYPPYLLGPCFKLFKLSIIREHKIEFPVDISYCEDAMFVMDYLMHATNYVSIAHSGYCYRQHGTMTLSTSFRENLFECEFLLNQKIERFLIVNDVDKAPICNNRLFKAYIHNLRKLSFSQLSKSQKKNYINELNANFCLTERFKLVRGHSVDDFIGLFVSRSSSYTFLLKILKEEQRFRKFAKQTAIKIRNLCTKK